MKASSPPETLRQFLRSLRWIAVARSAPPVAHTVAAELRLLAPEARPSSRPLRGRGLTVQVEDAEVPATARAAWLALRFPARTRATLEAASATHLYAFHRWLVETQLDTPRVRLTGRRRVPFAGNRPVWDLYFAQAARDVAGLDSRTYVREMARLGFTHLEVNRLASSESLEANAPGEVYARFYTYCPALDQFVASALNRGIYPRAYLQHNLRMLQEHCRLAREYGLVPSMTCFEPRSVPEKLLLRYPELRGARVDHPFRSFRPRFNLAVSHPVVRAHYRELMQKLLLAVPELGHLSVWSNDSGAGFEFTRSLYAGANGSAYLVREWSDPDVFVRSASRNIVDFLRLLQESGEAVRPGFRVATRLEPFGPERPHVMRAVGRGLDVEVASLRARGWESPARHPRYPALEVSPFSVYHDRFAPAERAGIRRLERRDCRTHVYHSHGPVNNFEPLLGIPAPWLTHAKLLHLAAAGADHLAHFGGIAPPALVPFPVNDDVARRFWFEPGRPADELIREIARDYAGAAHAPRLHRAWKLIEQGIRGFHPDRLYSIWGVWYRVWVRPLVPDIDAIPEARRAYYEKHLLATHHNPNRVDLSRDVLFHLMTAREAALAARRIERNALPPLDRARDLLREAPGSPPVLVDLQDRLLALRCWMRTRRNIAVWIATVPEYPARTAGAERRAARRDLARMVADEIDNARCLEQLVRRSKVAFMAVSGKTETTFVYDRHFGRHLRQKIRLMEEFGHLPPRVDPDHLWRVRNLPS